MVFLELKRAGYQISTDVHLSRIHAPVRQCVVSSNSDNCDSPKKKTISSFVRFRRSCSVFSLGFLQLCLKHTVYFGHCRMLQSGPIRAKHVGTKD